jgi:carboxypeptidase family protein
MSRVLLNLVPLVLVPPLISGEHLKAGSGTTPFVEHLSAVAVSDAGVTRRLRPGYQIIPPGAAVGAGQAPPRDLPAARTGTSRIRGRVLLADTGQPGRRATVRVTGGGLREPRSTVTDLDGRYEIGDLPSGRYNIAASKSTYVTITYGQTRPLEPGRPLDIGDNQVVDKVDFILPKGGVITGRIVDEYGEPVANARVQTVQNRFIGGQQRAMPSGQVFATSDTGEYRLWGLSPGQYLVTATSTGFGLIPENSDDRSGYAATYYPGTSNVVEAQPVIVVDGRTTSGVDIILVATRLARVSGTVVDGSRQPVTRGVVMARPRSLTGVFGSQAGQIRPDGTFAISGLAPGDYSLRATIASTQSGIGQAEAFVVADVTVAGVDITDVVLAPVQPAVVSGRLVFDPPAASLQPSMFQVAYRPRDPEQVQLPAGAGGPTINDDFTFELPAPPGDMIIGVTSRMPGGSWMVKSVRYESRDVTDEGLRLTAGGRFEDVEIVLTNRPQVLSGKISNAQGQMVADATVMIFAQDRERWLGTSRYQAIGRPDQNGVYSIRTLPPGEYYAVALAYVDPGRRGDPAYYEQHLPDAVSFTLREAETRALDLRLVVSR